MQIRSITVGELRDMLDEVGDDNLPVVFACDYGDRCHTIQALSITDGKRMPIGAFKDSAYSSSGVCIDFEQETYEETKTDVFVIHNE